jgi:cytochrome bd ubiquinol oxidase subunit I
MNLDPAMLARIQFAFTVSCHIIFPTISIGLAMFLAIVEGPWLKTRDPLYLQIYRFWLGTSPWRSALALSPASSFRSNSDWALRGLHRWPDPAIGPMIALEVLTSFFLEAGFLGIMLFGLHRVGPKLLFLRPAWWRSGLCSPRLGSSLPTAGCRPPTGSRS